MRVELAHRVAAELLEQRVRQDDAHHRLADDARRRHGADVASLEGGLVGLLGPTSTLASAFFSVAMGFIATRQTTGIAVGDAALEAAGAVGRPREAARRRVVVDGVVHARSPRVRAAPKPAPISTPLMAWMLMSACASRPSSLRSHCTWLPRPGMTPVATTSKTPPSVSPAWAASRMASFIRASAVGVGAGEVAGARPRAQLVSRGVARGRRLDRADGDDVREHVDADRAEQLAAHRADGGARRRLAGARALEDVAQIVPVVLQASREVGVARARARERLAAERAGGRATCGRASSRGRGS